MIARLDPFILLFLGLMAAGLHEGHELFRHLQYNRSLHHPDTLEIEDGTDPRLVAAKANFQASRGNWHQAIQLYLNAKAKATTGELRQKLAYNLGTLYLREASKSWQQLGVWDYSRVVTLLGLARDNLREAVRLDPEDLNARFNLEYAFRIQPPPRERQPAKWQGHKSSVFATLPGAPQGGP